MHDDKAGFASGTGTLLAGGVVVREVSYRFMRPPAADVVQTEGTVDITGLPEATVLAGADDLVLQLPDDRRLTVTLTSSSGRFVVRGVGLGPDAVAEFAQRYTAAWCGGDPAKVAAFFASDGSLTVNDGAPARGRAAIADVARGFMSAFPDMRVLMDAVVGEEDRVVYRWTLVGTNTGPGGTGRKVRISGAERWRLSDEGLIAESLGRFDADDYQRQLDGR